MKRFLPFAIAITVLVGIFAAFAFFAGDNWDRDRHDNAQVVQVVPAVGSTGNTFIIERDHRHFRPFGFLFFPLIFFGLFFLVSRLFWGGRRWGWNGQNPPGATPPWLAQWHREAHRADAPPPSDSQSTPPANPTDATPS